MQIPTYIINLKSRPERRFDVLKQFEGKPEFAVTVIEAIQNRRGLLGLWNTMKHILKNLVHEKDELILICQDDHQFTEHYSFATLQQSIEEAKELDADILLGGVSWFQSAFQSSSMLFWTEKFSGLQFAIIFRKFFKPLLNLELDGFDAGDYRISAFTDKKWFVYPFISTQSDYGYSDVTLKNNKQNRQTTLFRQSSNAVKTILEISECFRECNTIEQTTSSDIEEVSIPTFIINFAKQRDEMRALEEQFRNRKEFDISIVDMVNDPVRAISLWNTIRKIVTAAIDSDEDLIIICNENHVFTADYSKEKFLQSILTAHKFGADILLGCVSGGFSYVLPISKGLCWINSFNGIPFMVVYKKMFSLILNAPFDESVKPDELLSELATNRVSLYPFISKQKDNNYLGSNLPNVGFYGNNSYEQSHKRFNRVVQNFTLYAIGEKTISNSEVISNKH